MTRTTKRCDWSSTWHVYCPASANCTSTMSSPSSVVSWKRPRCSAISSTPSRRQRTAAPRPSAAVTVQRSSTVAPVKAWTCSVDWAPSPSTCDRSVQSDHAHRHTHTHTMTPHWRVYGTRSSRRDICIAPFRKNSPPERSEG